MWNKKEQISFYLDSQKDASFALGWRWMSGELLVLVTKFTKIFNFNFNAHIGQEMWPSTYESREL